MFCISFLALSTSLDPLNTHRLLADWMLYVTFQARWYCYNIDNIIFVVVVQSLRHVWLWPHGPQHTRLLCPLISHGACSNSCSLSQGYHLIMAPSAALFFLHSVFPSIWVFSVTWLFAWGGQSIGASASASVLSMNSQSSFPLGWTGLSSFCPRSFQESFPTPQFKSSSSLALSLLYGPTLTSIHDYWQNHSFDYTDLCWQSDAAAF